MPRKSTKPLSLIKPTDETDTGQTNQKDVETKVPKSRPTAERRGFVQGLFNELNEQLKRYLSVGTHLAELQGQMMIVERNLQLTRDLLESELSQTDEEVPQDWQKVLRKVRFVGARLGDACVEILREHPPMTTQEILDHLNLGQFRFRTGTPLREMNAALLRQSHVQKENDRWYVIPDAKPMREEVSRNNIEPEDEE
jgi:hypothetical protein